MSNLMRSEDLVTWAEAMGFLGAGSPEFKANARRLIIPQHKSMWRHIIKHVRPANEVAHIRKQLLAYKLEVENNSTINSSNKPVADYEAFLKKSTLEAKMTDCDEHTETKKEEIKTLSTKLESKGESYQSQKLEEKEKMEIFWMLRAKREELEKQVDNLKQMVSELDSVMQLMVSKATGFEYLGAGGMEILCIVGKRKLRNCFDVPRKPTIIVACSLILRNLPLGGVRSQCFTKPYKNINGLKLVELNEKFDVELEQLEANKQNIMSTMASFGDVFLIARAGTLNQCIESGGLEANGTGEAGEGLLLLPVPGTHCYNFY